VAYGRKVVGGITMHDIRRTVKTNMLAAGVDNIGGGYGDTGGVSNLQAAAGCSE
jgi:hypothetical protein